MITRRGFFGALISGGVALVLRKAPVPVAAPASLFASVDRRYDPPRIVAVRDLARDETYTTIRFYRDGLQREVL